MKVFISWSGEKSREVAVALREWLPLVMNSVEPFVSSKDIYAGTRWQLEIAAQLGSTNFGIVCVTADNQKSPWLNFESGALAKAVESSRVVPLAIDLKPSDIELPLGQFQGQPASELGVGEILNSINETATQPLDGTLLKRALAKWWPDLKIELDRIEADTRFRAPRAGAHRTDRELLEETLQTVRSLVSSRSGVSTMRSRDDFPLPGHHPLIRQIEGAFAEYPVPGSRILQAPGRIGVRAGGLLPEEVQVQLIESGDSFGIVVDFLPSSSERLREDDPDRSASSSAEGSLERNS